MHPVLLRSAASCVLLILVALGSATAGPPVDAPASSDADAPPPATLEAVAAAGAGTQIKFLADGQNCVIDITSPFGIGKATIRRRSANWPPAIRVRLHLKGLEHFSVTHADRPANADRVLNWSVVSGDAPVSTTSLRSGGKETVLDADSPFHTTARIVGDQQTIPLERGYFEVPLPSKLFQANPGQVQLKWIDFYR